MREIKFRAWDEVNGKMRWGNDNLMLTLGGCLHWDFAGNVEPIPKHENNYTLMQYTGLKDSEGREIYEGDILLHHHTVKDWIAPPIEWGMPWESCYGSSGIGYKLDQECASDAEVIGNRVENPELIEEELI